MLDRPFRVEIGPYWILLPEEASISAHVTRSAPGAYQMALTKWVVLLGRFQFLIHLDPINDLGGLKSFIDYTTKSDVTTPLITVNGVPGVMHGDYGPPRTWIDWWLKKGDTMICLCLQSTSFPFAEPNQAEIAEHNEIVGSLKYCRDFPSELPPQ
jgi:hypothetical protein